MWACRLDHIEHFQLLSQAETFRVDDADGIERDLIGRTWMHWAVRRMEPLECLQVCHFTPVTLCNVMGIQRVTYLCGRKKQQHIHSYVKYYRSHLREVISCDKV